MIMWFWSFVNMVHYIDLLSDVKPMFWVSLSLLIVVLWARHAWGTHLGCTTEAAPQAFPGPEPVWGWMALVGLLWWKDAPQQQPQERELWEDKVYCSWVLEAQRGRGGDSECGSGVLPLLRLTVGCPRSWGFILYWWILNIRAGIKAQERKSRVTQVVSYLSHLELSKKGNCVRGVAWLFV